MADAAFPSGARSVLKWARERPQAVAISERGAEFSYLALARQIAGAVAVLEAEGVRAGLIVGLQCQSPHVRLVLALACEVLGAVHLSFTEAQAAVADWVARRCQLFLAEDGVEQLSAIAPVVGLDAQLIARMMAPVGEAALERLATCHGPRAGVRISVTSGTTGTPKMVLKRRGALSAAIDGYDAALRPVAGDFTYLCRYNPTINGVYTDIIRALRFGNRVRFVWTFDEIAAACRSERCYAFLLTRDAEELAAACKARGVNLDMHYVDVTGSGVSPGLEAALKAWVTPFVGNIYSSNESSLIASREEGDLYRILDGVEVRIVDENGRPVRPGVVGRICVRSALLPDGYLWDEPATARHFREGWFLMSDLGALPAPGKLQVLGRVDDMLNIGGVKIPPDPIQQLLKAEPGVSDAMLLQVETSAAVGMICAMVEVEADVAHKEVLGRVVEVMRKKAGGAFVVRLEAEFPRTETGKVRRKALQARAEASLREPAAVDG